MDKQVELLRLRTPGGTWTWMLTGPQVVLSLSSSTPKDHCDDKTAIPGSFLAKGDTVCLILEGNDRYYLVVWDTIQAHKVCYGWWGINNSVSYCISDTEIQTALAFLRLSQAEACNETHFPDSFVIIHNRFSITSPLHQKKNAYLLLICLYSWIVNSIACEWLSLFKEVIHVCFKKCYQYTEYYVDKENEPAGICSGMSLHGKFSWIT